jgi:enediyne biosynthesis protein E4
MLCALILLLGQFFRNAAPDNGIAFRHENHPTPEKHLVETMPGGVAALDYNNDGRIDLFFSNGAALPSLRKNEARFANRLYRNDGGGRFADVTTEAGLAGAGYAMGAAVADFDNDGFTDIFVPGAWESHLYRNEGGRRFVDVPWPAMNQPREWNIAAAWLDYDNDGLLDLFVANYGVWRPEQNPFCGDRAKGQRTYCHPRYFPPRPMQLFRNLGAGRFADVSESSGIAKAKGRGMSVAPLDFNRDGLMDVFVTSDALPALLFRNLGKGQFREEALELGIALPENGKPISAMGVEARDVNADGWPDLMMTALNGETFPLFLNEKGQGFTDATLSSRIGQLSNGYGGWSLHLADFNNDGLIDCFTANGHVDDLVHLYQKARFEQVNTLLLRTSAGAWEKHEVGGPAAHRGAAVADFDGDGRLDVAVSVLQGPAELWQNTAPPAKWIAVQLEGKKSNRSGIGARVEVAGQTQWQGSAAGYASSSLAPLHFGLGTRSASGPVRITWPSGVVDTFTSMPLNQMTKIVEGQAASGSGNSAGKKTQSLSK